MILNSVKTRKHLNLEWRVNNEVGVFFDGACHLCSREIDYYENLSGSEQIHFVDISGIDFSAEDFGFDPIAVNSEMHVKSPTCEFFTGVDAVLENLCSTSCVK